MQNGTKNQLNKLLRLSVRKNEKNSNFLESIFGRLRVQFLS